MKTGGILPVLLGYRQAALVTYGPCVKRPVTAM
jgi:hypothetical protein